MKKIFDWTIDFLSSYLFAVILLLFLLLLTYRGTIQQKELGLFAVQAKYFDSLFLVDWWWGKIPVVLPGVYLLLVLLAVNLIAGGILRMRKKWSLIGIYIAHLGVLVLLTAGFVSYQKKEEGHLTLFEGESSSEFVSYHDWEIAIYPVSNGGPVEERIVPPEDLRGIDPGESRTFTAAELPFDLTVWNWLPNCRPIPVQPGHDHDGAGFGGFVLRPLELSTQAEANTAGAYATVKLENGEVRQGILWGEPAPPWGRQMYPLLVTVDGRKWAIDLRKVRKNLPFRITLDEFHHEFHPGTQMAKVFRSVVTKTENGVDQKVRIEMNEPLRDEGYTLYQSSWGPQNAAPGAPLFSGFSVVKNPADQWPLISTCIIVLGLAVHFVRKLYVYLVGEAKRRQQA